MNPKSLSIWLCLIIFFVACTSQTTDSVLESSVVPMSIQSVGTMTAVPIIITPYILTTAMPASTQPAQTTPTPIAKTVVPLSSPSVSPDYLQEAGQLESGIFFLGNKDAPVAITDFSDFL